MTVACFCQCSPVVKFAVPGTLPLNQPKLGRDRVDHINRFAFRIVANCTYNRAWVFRRSPSRRSAAPDSPREDLVSTFGEVMLAGARRLLRAGVVNLAAAGPVIE